MEYFAVATFAFCIGFAVGALVIRRSIQKYGLVQTHYENNYAEKLSAYKATLGVGGGEAPRPEAKPDSQESRTAQKILAGDFPRRDR
jgi:hypothetical protein